MIPVEALLFDLDNTLYDREAAFFQWANAYLDNLSPRSNDSERQELLREIIERDADGYGSKQAIFGFLAERFPPSGIEAGPQTERFYDELMRHIRLDESTRGFLDRLDKASFPWGIITNGSDRQMEKIARLELKPPSGCVFVSGVFGAAKPDVSIFRAAAACVGKEAQNILFAGDNPVADIEGAHRAGMQTAWLARGKAWTHSIPERPDFILASLSRLADYLPRV